MSTLYIEWKTIDWKLVQTKVFAWQQEIYTASKKDDIKTVRKIQHKLLNSYEARLLAVRRVTQDNRGKKTAGVDGVKNLTPEQRLEMVGNLNFPTVSKPVRRVWIPKPGKKELRPLGIPTMYDRCLQGLFKLAMEPEWEARFESNSFGFRPGRNAHDAVGAIKHCITTGKKYVIDADITQCFPSINHTALLDKIGFKGKYRKQLKYWLKAGVIDANVFQKTEIGTPQGGIISPLLANIALHGLEKHLKGCFSDIPTFYGTSGKKISSTMVAKGLHVIRYADDFVILHSSREVIFRCLEETKKFLSTVGLELSVAKTRLTHTLELGVNDTKELGFDGELGFNFLGFTFKQFKSVHRSSTWRGTKLGYKTLIYPSKNSLKKHQRKLREIILKTGKRLDQVRLIALLNPVIRGWASYFGVSDANTMGFLSKQDRLMYLKLRKWSKQKGSVKKGSTYWFKTPTKNWKFGKKNVVSLVSHIEYSFPFGPGGYVRIRGESSPFDGNEKYWNDRNTSNPRHTTIVKILLKKQKGKCKLCGLQFTDDDVMEKDHIIPLRKPLNGSNELKNLQLLHGHCHDTKTAQEKD